MPAAKANLRPLTRPSEIRRGVCAAAGSSGARIARAKTFVWPPAITPNGLLAASSVAWPRRSVSSVSTAPRRSSTRRTRSSVTRVAYGLTIRLVRTDAEDTARAPPLRGSRVAAHPVDEQREEAVGDLVRVATGLEPGVCPVRRRQQEQRRGSLVQIGAELAELAALAEELADPLFVPPPLGDDLV